MRRRLAARRGGRWGRTFATFVTVLPLVVATVGAATAEPGAPDESFGLHGEVATPYFSVVGLEVDARGRVLVAGLRSENGTTISELARFTADGVPDAGFGQHGVVAIPDDDVGPNTSEALAIASDGSPLLALSGVESVAGTALHVLAVARFGDDGTIDRAFGTDGLVRVFFDFDQRVTPQIVPRADGGVRVAGILCSPTACAVRSQAFDRNGDAETGFTTGFDLAAPLQGSLLARPDEQIIAATMSYHASDGPLPISLRRYDPDGRRDPAFAAGGAVSGIAFSRRGFCLLASDHAGSLVVAGTDPAGDGIVTRFSADGARDRTFGTNGTASLAISGAFETVPVALTIGVDGRIVIVGGARVSTERAEWFLAALEADGTAARDFGVDGVATRPPTVGEDHARLVRLLPDGRVLTVGRVGGTFVIARYEGFPRACGDADGNGAVTVTDGVQVLRAAADLPSACLAWFCDVDGSGDLGVTDGVRTLRAAAGLPAAFACGTR